MVSLAVRLDMYRHGFMSEAPILYDFETHGRAAYVTSVQHYTRIRDINPCPAILRNKLIFHTVMARWPGSTPRLFGIVRGGRFLADAEACGSAAAGVLDVCDAGQALFLKPVSEDGGKRMHVLARSDHGYRHNGRIMDRGVLEAALSRLDGFLVTELVRPAPYAKAIFPDALNTIRIVTMRSPDTGEPFVAFANHRFGTRASGFVDNWGMGGLNAHIDIASGHLGPAVELKRTPKLSWLPHHPDSGAPIEGVAVPDWEAVKSTVLGWAAGLPMVLMCGWDVAVDESGAVRALEGNGQPSTNQMQVHRPLLTDERVRAFFRAHGVIR
jgi:hypothetical protein